MMDYSRRIEQARQLEYPQLLGTTYLDHAGTTLYAQSTIQSFARDMQANLYGNPHSASPSSALSTVSVDQVRGLVLQYFRADPKKFDVVFVANATAAIRVVAHAFQDQGFWYGYHKDAHTSLVGVRELASAGHQCFSSDQKVESWIHSGLDVEMSGPRLFGYPAQSNMTGYRPPLEWSSQIREKTRSHKSRTYTLLDAASYLTTGNLDLSNANTSPDFVALSFYKIFGFPDLGALIVRKDSSEVLLSRRYFGGGTVDMVVAVGDSWHRSHGEHPHDALEDGTLPFHNIIALKHAMEVHKRIYQSPSQTSAWAAHLSHHAYAELTRLMHWNGMPVAIVRKDTRAQYGQSTTQGPIISFNVQCHRGKIIGNSRFETLAVACGIQLRTGGVCNPGGVSTTLELDAWEMKRNFLQGMRCGGDVDVLGGKPTGIIRISIGAMTTLGDVQTFIDFVRQFFVCSNEPALETPSTHGLSQKSGVATSIQPIQGGPTMPVPFEEFYSAVEANTEYAGLHEQWIIANPTTGKRLGGHQIQTRLQGLSIHLDPARGVMTISHQGSKSVEPAVITVNIQPWEQVQPQDFLSDKTTEVDGQVHPDQEVEEFFTSLLGVSSTLARQTKRPEVQIKSRKGQHVCVAWWCNKDLHSAKELEVHYREHATVFSERTTIRLPNSGQDEAFSEKSKNLTVASDYNNDGDLDLKTGKTVKLAAKRTGPLAWVCGLRGRRTTAGEKS